MWQSGCWVEVWQGGDHTNRTNDLWLRGIWPHRKPRPIAGRAGTVWGWNGHTAQNHCRTQPKDGLIEATKVKLVREKSIFKLFQNKHNLKASLIYCYYYLLLLSEVTDRRSPGSPKPLVPDLLSHRVARSVPEINTASAIMAKPPLSGRGWVKQLYSVVPNTERHHSLGNCGKTCFHFESTFSAVLFSAARRRCCVVQTAGGVGFSGGLHQLQEVLGCSNHSIWQTKAPPTTKGSWGQLDQGHTGIKPISHNPLIYLIYHYHSKCQTSQVNRDRLTLSIHNF